MIGASKPVKRVWYVGFDQESLNSKNAAKSLLRNQVKLVQQDIEHTISCVNSFHCRCITYPDVFHHAICGNGTLVIIYVMVW